MFGVERDAVFSEEFLKLEKITRELTEESEKVKAEQATLRGSLISSIFAIAPAVDMRPVENGLLTVAAPKRSFLKRFDHEKAIATYMDAVTKRIGSMSCIAEFAGTLDDEQIEISTYGIPSSQVGSVVSLTTESLHIEIDQEALHVNGSRKYLTPTSLDEVSMQIEEYRAVNWTHQKVTYLPLYGSASGYGSLMTYYKNLERAVNGVYLPIHENGSTEM